MDDIENQKICTICNLDDEADTNEKKFIDPCLCKENLKWVHVSCLKHQLCPSHNPQAMGEPKCKRCFATYKMKLETKKKFEPKTAFKRDKKMTTVFFLVSGLFFACLIASAVLGFVFGLKRVPAPQNTTTENTTTTASTTVSALSGFKLIIFLFLIFVAAMLVIFMIYLFRTAFYKLEIASWEILRYSDKISDAPVFANETPNPLSLVHPLPPINTTHGIQNNLVSHPFQPQQNTAVAAHNNPSLDTFQPILPFANPDHQNHPIILPAQNNLVNGVSQVFEPARAQSPEEHPILIQDHEASIAKPLALTPGPLLHQNSSTGAGFAKNQEHPTIHNKLNDTTLDNSFIENDLNTSNTKLLGKSGGLWSSHSKLPINLRGSRTNLNSSRVGGSSQNFWDQKEPAAKTIDKLASFGFFKSDRESSLKKFGGIEPDSSLLLSARQNEKTEEQTPLKNIKNNFLNSKSNGLSKDTKAPDSGIKPFDEFNDKFFQHQQASSRPQGGGHLGGNSKGQHSEDAMKIVDVQREEFIAKIYEQ